MSENITVGGQAVIEGVMMIAKNRVATAVRKKDGSIVLNVDNFNSITTRFRIAKLPFIRGVVSLFEMMYLGMKTLTWSVNQQEENGQEMSRLEIGITFAISIIASIVMFVLVPYGLTYLIAKQQTLLFNMIDGVFRLLIFVTYLVLIARMSDVRRIFQYHGAEHKTVNCFEQHKELTPENVLACSRIHPRCGTSLIVFVLGLSIVMFSLLKSPTWYVNLAIRILLIPVIAGISYEVVKFSARQESLFFKTLIKPGLLTQQLTTREPSREQCEVAIDALNGALA